MTQTRVRYPETDRMGVAWHGHYLAWFELGRTEWMRAAGLPYGELEDRDGLRFPVVEIGARYRRSARYDDILEIETRLASVSGARVRFSYRVVRRGNEELLAEGFSEHAAVDRDGRPCRLPPEVRERMARRAEAQEAETS